MERFNIREILTARAGQRSFHVAAEQHVRVEMRNMSAGEDLESFRYSGNVVLTVFAGAFVLSGDGKSMELVEMDQVIISSGEHVALRCEQAGALQLIWSPPYAVTEK